MGNVKNNETEKLIRTIRLYLALNKNNSKGKAFIEMLKKEKAKREKQ